MSNHLFNKYLSYNIQSIFVRDLRAFPLLPGQDILSIKPKDEKISNEEEVLTVPVHIEDIGMKVNKQIECIRDIHRQDLNKYLRKIKEVASLANWSEEKSMKLLRITTDEIYHPIFEHCNTIENSLKKLNEAKYPKHTADKILIDLKRTLQSNFIKIRDYYEEIKNLTEIAAIVFGYTKKEKTNKIKEVFIQNLTDDTRKECCKNKLKEVGDILEYIEELEIIINTQNMRKRESTIKHQEKQPKKIRYECEKHGRNLSHNTKDCYFLNKKEDKALVITEKAINKLISFKGKINNTVIDFTVDSASEHSYINFEIVRECSLNKEYQKMQMANGESTLTKGTFTSKFELTNKEMPEQEFRTVENLCVDALLGLDWLTENKVIINTFNRTISINGETTITNTLTPEEKIIKGVEWENEEIVKKFNYFLKDKINYSNKKIGLIDNIEFKIDVTNDLHTPYKNYAVPMSIRNQVKAEINELLDKGIITRTSSNISSPAFVIKKKNGKIRLVVDYRIINKNTISENTPFISINEVLGELSKSKVFSTIDLNSGYYQIKMCEESKKFTTFNILNEQFYYNRMPFGLKNAPRIFQRAMNDLFKKLEYVKVYLDDILISSRNYQEHYKHCTTVLNILHDKGITINKEKSIFFRKEINYLGNTINKDGIKADIGRIQLMAAKKVPKNKRELQSIIGYINWFRPYIPNLSKLLASINNKINDEKIIWTKEDENNMDSIYKKIKENILLSFPDVTSEFILEVDASENAVGGILYQKKKIIGIFSKKLSKAETNYSNPEKEFLGIYLSVNYFINIIYGCRVIVRTDHINTLSDTNNLTNRIERWKLSLSDLDLKYEYLKGQENLCADYLSRCLIVKEDTVIYPWELIKKIQEKFNKETKKEEYTNKKNISVNIDNKVIIPKEGREEILKEIHKNLNHVGSTRMFNGLNKYIWCDDLKLSIANITKKCSECQIYKNNNIKYGKLYGQIKSNEVLDLVCSDIFGPICTEQFESEMDTEKFYFITLTDVFSRYTRIYAISNITAKTIANVIEKYFREEGIPRRLLSDRGTQYTSMIMNKLLKKHGVMQILNVKDNPQANGVSESLNKQIAFTLRYNIGNNIKEIIKLIETGINLNYHTSIKYPPQLIKSGTSELDPWKRNIKINNNEIIENYNLSYKKNSHRMNKSRVEYIYKENDFCLVKNRNRVSKICKYYNGPYKIIKINKGNAVIDIDGIETLESIRNIKPMFS